MKTKFLHRSVQCYARKVETFARAASDTTTPHVSVMVSTSAGGLFATTTEFTPDEARVHARHLLDCANVAEGKEVTE